MSDPAQFEEFVLLVEPRLRRALIGAVGVDRVEDAVAEALAYAFEHWDDVSAITNPAGYLFRVGQSRSRRRRCPRLLRAVPDGIPDVEPASKTRSNVSPTSRSRRRRRWHGRSHRAMRMPSGRRRRSSDDSCSPQPSFWELS